MEEKLYSSAAAEASAVASAAPAYVKTIVCTNVNAAARFLHVFDSASVPANATAPDICINVPAGDTVVFNVPRNQTLTQDGGLDRYPKFTAGVAVCLSTTAATKTVTLTADGVFTVLGEAA